MPALPARLYQVRDSRQGCVCSSLSTSGFQRGEATGKQKCSVCQMLALPSCHSPQHPRDGGTAWSLSLGCSPPEFQSVLSLSWNWHNQSLHGASAMPQWPKCALHWPNCVLYRLCHAQSTTHTWPSPNTNKTISGLVSVLRSSLFPITGVRFFQIKVD